MIQKEKYPILEFDSSNKALINPSDFICSRGKLIYDCLIITFFKDVIEQLLNENKIKYYQTISGENPREIYQFVDAPILIIHGFVGCPACGGTLDELIGLGIKKVMFCGGGGVLDKNMDVGQLFVVESAIRDEGFSYHYLKPSRIVNAQSQIVELICEHLDQKKISYLKGVVWTTDAIYRETKERILLRKSEGAKIVEMEQAGCLAVSQFRNIAYGAILYCGDDVSGNMWDRRDWKSRKGVRYLLVQLCKEIVLKME